jgi:hypothetical protein
LGALPSAGNKQTVNNAPVLHVSRQQAKRQFGCFAPRHFWQAIVRCASRRQEHVSFAGVSEVNHKWLGVGVSLMSQSFGEYLQSLSPPCHQDQIVSIARKVLSIGCADAG